MVERGDGGLAIGLDDAERKIVLAVELCIGNIVGSADRGGEDGSAAEVDKLVLPLARGNQLEADST